MLCYRFADSATGAYPHPLQTLGFPKLEVIYDLSYKCFDAHNQDFYSGAVSTPTMWSLPDDGFLPTNVNDPSDPSDDLVNDPYLTKAPLCTWNVSFRAVLFGPALNRC